MNKVELLGRLTRDPDIRWSNSANNEQLCIARYTLAVDRRGKQKEGQQNADFISCVAFGKAAEFCEKYLKQGTKMAVTGRLQTGSYEKDGVKHYTTDVVIEEQEFAESKKSEGGSEEPQSAPEFMDIPEGSADDLPWK